MFEHVPRLQSSHTFVLHGQRVAGGCAFQGGDTIRPGDATVEDDEIGYSASLCQMIMQRGIAPPARPLPANGLKRINTVWGPAPPVARPVTNSSSCPPIQPNCPWYNSTAHTYSWYTDPINLPLTSLNDILSWYYTFYGCIPSYSYYEDVNYWAATTGWNQNSRTQTFSPNCDPYELDTHAGYSNGIFCAGQTTYINYYYNRIFGHNDGSIGGYWYSVKSGACTNLITEHHQYGYGTGPT